MPRLKTPPHGKAIISARDEDIMLYKVWVIYGRDWTLPGAPGQPAIIVPADYKPGVYDFSLLVGLRADIVCRRGAADPVGLACEVAEYAAPVIVHWVAGDNEWPVAPGTQQEAELTHLFPRLDVENDLEVVKMRNGSTGMRIASTTVTRREQWTPERHSAYVKRALAWFEWCSN